MKKTYYSPAMEETMWQGLNAICEGSGDDGGQPDGTDGNPFVAPRRL